MFQEGKDGDIQSPKGNKTPENKRLQNQNKNQMDKRSQRCKNC